MVLEQINLFPESRYLRCRSRPDFDHKCGGLVSLLIMAILLALLVVKLIECFSYSTVFFKDTTVVNPVPRNSTLTTSYDNPSIAPYMISLKPMNSCPDKTTITASLATKLGASSSYTNTAIPLERCTKAHFQKFPNLGITFQASEKCLPLNRSFPLGGSKLLSNDHSFIQYQVFCSCGSQCGSVRIFAANAHVNPNEESPFVYSFDEFFLDLNHFTFNKYFALLDQNTVETDEGLLPFSKADKKEESLSINSLSKKDEVTYAGLPFRMTTLDLERSTVTREVQRSYLKIIDVLSYVGGFFPALFAFFFFLKYFGFYYYESIFTFLHFKCPQTKDIGIQMYFKRLIYSFLSKLGLASNWKIAQRQMEINDFTNKMLDVNYLYKRIEFLETAISSVLSDHQLKGVYLSQVTIRSAEKQFTKHILRDRLIKYLQHKADIDKGQRMKEEQRRKKFEEHQIVLKPQTQTQIAESNRNLVDHEMVDMPRKIKKSSSKLMEEVVEKELEGDKAKKGKFWVERKKSEIIKDTLEDQDETLLHFRERNRLLLKRQAQMIELADSDDFDDKAIYKDLQSDLKRLLYEARTQEDPISCRIVQNIDDWLMKELEIAIEDYEKLGIKPSSQELVAKSECSGGNS